MTKVLIVDDDRHLVASLMLRCRLLGFDTRFAYDGVSALNKALVEPPDIVCLDINMPLGNGLSVCEMLTSDDRFGSMPIIVMTGNTDQETIQRCHRLCAYYVLKCPDLWQRLEPLLLDLARRKAVACPSLDRAQC